jgi:DinB family
MIIATKGNNGNLAERQKLLIEANVIWLRQAQELLEQFTDATYTASPQAIALHCVGSHMRHILEFYECFLDGLESSHVDYDARNRDLAIETSRQTALAKVRSIIRALETDRMLLTDAIIWVRMEDAQALRVAESFMISSMSRELQTLSSHTIHHFALIAVTLRVLGHEVDRDFGMAPSTLRYLSSRRRSEATEEAA